MNDALVTDLPAPSQVQLMQFGAVQPQDQYRLFTHPVTVTQIKFPQLSAVCSQLLYACVADIVAT